MQRSATNQNFRYDDPVWFLLAELSFGDFLSNHERIGRSTAGFLFRPLRELGMSPDCIENISRTLAGFAREASVPTKHGRLESPGRIRLFCQKKIIDHVNPMRSNSRSFRADKAVEYAQIILDSDMKMIGGWGYFLIERGENVPSESSTTSWNSVDLYLYKEGE